MSCLGGSAGQGWALLLRAWLVLWVFLGWVWLFVAVWSASAADCEPAVAGITQGLCLPSCGKSLVWAGGLMGSVAGNWLPQAVLWSSGSRGFP